MITLVWLTFAMTLNTSTTVWMDAYEARAQGVTLEQAGAYKVWVWARTDAPSELSLGGVTLTAPKKEKPDPPFAWTMVGETQLEKGHADVALGEGIARLALSTKPEFDPATLSQDLSVLFKPQSLNDRRLLKTRDTGTVFTMPVYGSRDTWEPYAETLRRRILTGCGLRPMPTRGELNAHVFDAIEHEDYIIEKVYFEAHPGYFVTGNLYRPKGAGPYPGVVCPHGHWQHGRLEDSEMCSVPGRCITFARMGIVAFSYDMIGYNDSLQLSPTGQHNGGGIPAERSKELGLWGIHAFSLQLWSSVRAVDFLQSLSCVDDGRIACTGASGGGTQTFALTAIDPRVTVSAPVNMISCNMQGGCPCENAPLIRLNASNMQIGALMAPRPLLMVSATGDWTKETLRVEYPAIRSIYTLYDSEEKVETTQIDSGHNYNKTSREAVYRFFGKWLLNEGDKYKSFSEPAFTVDPPEKMRVFPDGKLPEGTPDADAVFASLKQAGAAKWEAAVPKDSAGRNAFLGEYRGLFHDMMGTVIPEPNTLAPERTGYHERQDYLLERWVLRRCETGEAVPAVFYRPKDAERRDAVLLVHGEGKSALMDLEASAPGALILDLLKAGKTVMAIDAFLIGDHNSPFEKAERIQSNFTETFLPTDTAYRVQDVLTAAAYLRSRRDLSGAVDLVGLGKAGMWCLFASAQDASIRRTIIDANEFKNQDDEAWVNEYYAPSIRSVGDVATAATFVAPRPLWIVNTGNAFDADGIRQAYKTAGADTLDVEKKSIESAKLVSLLSGNG